MAVESVGGIVSCRVGAPLADEWRWSLDFKDSVDHFLYRQVAAIAIS